MIYYGRQNLCMRSFLAAPQYCFNFPMFSLYRSDIRGSRPKALLRLWQCWAHDSWVMSRKGVISIFSRKSTALFESSSVKLGTACGPRDTCVTALSLLAHSLFTCVTLDIPGEISEIVIRDSGVIHKCPSNRQKEDLEESGYRQY